MPLSVLNLKCSWQHPNEKKKKKGNEKAQRMGLKHVTFQQFVQHVGKNNEVQVDHDND